MGRLGLAGLLRSLGGEAGNLRNPGGEAGRRPGSLGTWVRRLEASGPWMGRPGGGWAPWAPARRPVGAHGPVRASPVWKECAVGSDSLPRPGRRQPPSGAPTRKRGGRTKPRKEVDLEAGQRRWTGIPGCTVTVTERGGISLGARSVPPPPGSLGVLPCRRAPRASPVGRPLGPWARQLRGLQVGLHRWPPRVASRVSLLIALGYTLVAARSWHPGLLLKPRTPRGDPQEAGAGGGGWAPWRWTEGCLAGLCEPWGSPARLAEIPPVAGSSRDRVKGGPWRGHPALCRLRSREARQARLSAPPGPLAAPETTFCRLI